MQAPKFRSIPSFEESRVFTGPSQGISDGLASVQQNAIKSLIPPKIYEVVLFDEKGAIAKRIFTDMEPEAAQSLNEKAIRILTNVSAYLKNPSNSLEKDAKKTYKFYKRNVLHLGRSSSKEQNERFANSLDLFCLNIKRNIESSIEDKERALIREIGAQDSGYLRNFENELRELKGTKVQINSVGEDLYRHLMSGVITFATKEDDNLFATAGVSQHDLVATKNVMKQTEITLRTEAYIQEILNHLKFDVEKRINILERLKNCLPKIKELHKILPFNTFEVTYQKNMQSFFLELAKSDLQDKQVARLMFLSAQSFYLGTARVRSMLYRHPQIEAILANGDKSLDFKYIKENKKVGKEILYYFDEGQIIVKHYARFDYQDPYGKTDVQKVYFIQITELKNVPGQEGEWQASDEVEVHVPNGAEDIMAKKLMLLYQALQFPAKLVYDS